MKQVAREIFEMENSVSTTVGGCAMNTARAANFYLQALDLKSKVLTVGSIGTDDAAKIILEKTSEEELMTSFHQDETAITG
jgi:bifunctional ADP-heptose synthase (sugar kinase/adenylyltransferase)